MKNVVFALCMVGMALVACNRTEGLTGNPPTADMGGGGKRFLPPTDYTPSLVPPVCGGLGELCCSDGDGLVCHDGLVCVDGSTCQDPNGGGDMTTVADLGTPDMGGGDSGSGGDMSGSPDLGGSQDMTPAPDMSGPDDPACTCDKEGHGKGLGHCKEQHLANSSGHGNGHCKYDCEL